MIGQRTIGEVEALVAENAKMLQLQATLFASIEHGDDEHRAWLKEAINAHFSGARVPECRGSGRRDAENTKLRCLIYEVVEFYDALGREHAPGEASLLDRLAESKELAA